MNIKKVIKNICPKFLNKYAISLFRDVRLSRYRIDELLHSKGMQYYCPCCKLKINAFVKADYLDPKIFNPKRYKNTKQDVLCPACMSLPRHRILAAWFEEHKEVIQAKKTLYFAPEYSMMLWMKRNGISLTTADLFNDADIKLDIQNTGLLEESYDVIICNHVLEHVDDYKTALTEMQRVLRSGGSFICSFPMDPNIDLVDEDDGVKTAKERLEKFGQIDHKRVFGMNAGRLLEEAGFSVKTINGEECSDEILPVVGPAGYDMNVIFCCYKN